MTVPLVGLNSRKSAVSHAKLTPYSSMLCARTMGASLGATSEGTEDGMLYGVEERRGLA